MSETMTLVAAGDGYPNYTEYNKDMVVRLAGSTPSKALTNVLLNIAMVLGVQIIDPILDAMKGALDAAKDAITAALVVPLPYVFSESGETFSDKNASERVTHLRALIEAHRASGSSIDQRAPRWLVIAGKIAPWAEVLGIAVFVTALWNIFWLKPWTDWLSFFTALVLVIGMPIMQKYFAEHGGKAHNDYRLAKYEGLDFQAHEHLAKRNWYIAGTAIVATAGMVILAVRGIMALDAPSLWQLAIIGTMAAIVGYGTAVLAYAAIAVDGTRYSRESDELTVQGEAHAADWQADVATAESALQQAENDEEDIINKDFPKVLEIVRQQPDGDREEALCNLPPLADRAKRTVTLMTRRESLAAELKAVKTDNRPAFLPKNV